MIGTRIEWNENASIPGLYAVCVVLYMWAGMKRKIYEWWRMKGTETMFSNAQSQ